MLMVLRAYLNDGLGIPHVATSAADGPRLRGRQNATSIHPPYANPRRVPAVARGKLVVTTVLTHHPVAVSYMSGNI